MTLAEPAADDAVYYAQRGRLLQAGASMWDGKSLGGTFAVNPLHAAAAGRKRQIEDFGNAEQKKPRTSLASA